MDLSIRFILYNNFKFLESIYYANNKYFLNQLMKDLISLLANIKLNSNHNLVANNSPLFSEVIDG